MTSKDKPFEHILIIGCGDIGLRVAKLWQKSGKPVIGVVRNATSLAKLEQQNIKAISADLDKLDNLVNLPVNNALIYYFAPPPAKGTEDPRMVNFLASRSKSALPTSLVYISTSGVYGNQHGKLINEQTPTNPQVDRARRRYHAEQQLQNWGKENQIPVIILRVGGIYGPGRLPLQRIKDQVPMVYEKLAPQTNRIHADDLAQICVAAAIKVQPSQIYNVSDGTNSNMTEYFNTIADFFDLPRPPLVDWQEAKEVISPGMMSYLKESRRMDNSLMLQELGITLQYPDLKSGLMSCINTDN